MEMIKLNKFEGKETALNEAVFLGGTCDSSTWRDELAECLGFTGEDVILVDPRVPDYVWERDSKLEEIAKKTCPVIVFGITNTPNTASIYSFVEASWLAAKGKMVIVYCNPEEFEDPVKKSIKNSLKFFKDNGIILTSTINELAALVSDHIFEEKSVEEIKTIKRYGLFLYKTKERAWDCSVWHHFENVIEVSVEIEEDILLHNKGLKAERALYQEAVSEVLLNGNRHLESLKLIRESDSPILKEKE